MRSIALDESAMSRLLQYHYPGNVRELQYTIEKGDHYERWKHFAGERPDLLSPIESTQVASNDADDLNLSSIEKNTILK